MKLLFELTKLNNISFVFLADFKLLLICLGKQTATSSYPCPYCTIVLGDMRKQVPMIGDKEVVNELTFGKLHEDHERFQKEYKGNGKKAKLANSTVKESILLESIEASVLAKCPPPEFHLMEGFVNHVFFQGLVKVIGYETAMAWPKKFN